MKLAPRDLGRDQLPQPGTRAFARIFAGAGPVSRIVLRAPGGGAIDLCFSRADSAGQVAAAICFLRLKSVRPLVKKTIDNNNLLI
jgi:hypothetical protein